MFIFHITDKIKGKDIGVTIVGKPLGEEELIHALPRHGQREVMYPPYAGLPLESKDGKRYFIFITHSTQIWPEFQFEICVLVIRLITY